MAGINLNVDIAFSSSIGVGNGASAVIAMNSISQQYVNYTFSAVGGSTDLPMSEYFYVLSDTLVNNISLNLNGLGKVDVSIGTNPWQADVLAPLIMNVNGMGWYNVTFPTIKLQGSVQFQANRKSKGFSPED